MSFLLQTLNILKKIKYLHTREGGVSVYNHQSRLTMNSKMTQRPTVGSASCCKKSGAWSDSLLKSQSREGARALQVRELSVRMRMRMADCE